MNIASIDLNLLVAFEALLREGSVTGAAAHVGVTQPAMSSALARLRNLFGDSLFVRGTRRMVPTSRALEIAPHVTASLDHVRLALHEPAFVPREARARFRIIATDYIEAVLLPAVWKRLSMEAPTVALGFRRAPTLFGVPQTELESGAADLAIGPYATPTPQSGLLSRQLFSDKLVCIVRRGHPRIRERLSLKQFLAAEHAAMFSMTDHKGMIDRVLADRGLHRHVAVSVPDFVPLGILVAGTDLVATVPERFAAVMALVLGLRMLRVPVPVPPLRIGLLWHSRASEQPLHRWLRELIVGCA
jgi:DNA-binding transcriptional LysR family regulator